MNVNKDLADAVMMISFISLVLVGTTTFDSESTKNMIMVILAVITVGMLGLRIKSPMNHKDDKDAF